MFFKCFFLIFFYFFFASFFIVSFSLVVFIVSSPLSNFITAILTFIKFISKDFREHLRRSTMYLFLPVPRGGSRTAATSKMEHFVIIVNGFQLNGLRAPSWMLQQSQIRPFILDICRSPGHAGSAIFVLIQLFLGSCSGDSQKNTRSISPWRINHLLRSILKSFQFVFYLYKLDLRFVLLSYELQL